MRVDRVRVVHRARFEHAPPLGDLGFDRVPPAAIALAFEVREQDAEGLGGVADQVQLGWKANAEHAPVDVDLNTAGLPGPGQEFGVRKVRSDHQECVAFHHQVPARLGPEKPDGPGDKGQIVRHRRLAEQRLGNACAEHLGDL